MNNNMNVKSGLLWNALNSFGRLGLSFLATVFLSRILTPNDFGTYGILLIFITISELLADSGMASYIVKQHNIDSLDYDTLFIYNLVVSTILYIILFVSAPFIASFYGDESLVIGTRLSGIVIVIQSMSIIAAARLLKELSFKILAIISILSGMIGLISAILWALFVGGYFALILQSIVSVSLNSFGQMWIAKYVPHFRFDISRFKKQFAFGINLMGSTLLQSVTGNISNNIVAKLFNFNLAGIYVQSAKLQSIPTSLVQSILDKTFFPVFSKLNTDLILFNSQACQMSRMAYALCFPLISMIICFARPIILIVLGRQWVDCIWTFQILMFASYPLLVKNVNRNTLKSLGYTKNILMMEIYPFVLLAGCIVISIYVNSYLMLVFSFVLSNLLSSILSLYYVSKCSKQKISILIKDVIIFTPIIGIAVISVLLKNEGIINYLVYVFIAFLYFYICRILGISEYVKIEQQFITILYKLKKR